MISTAYNTSDRPVVIDAEGRMIGGREWGSVDTTDDLVKQLVDTGDLVFSDEPAAGASGVNPGARAAFDGSKELSNRIDALSSSTKDELLTMAREAGIIGDDETPTKTELEAMLGRRPEIATTTSPSTDTSTQASSESFDSSPSPTTSSKTRRSQTQEA